jgi:uncharacterized protein (TIGR00730 family)
MLEIRSICINCGSNSGSTPKFQEAARALGAHLASGGITTVFGGANVGLMGAVANAALEKGGRVIGVIPEAIASKVGHKGLTELHVVGTMHERKMMMFNLSDGFIALPGGIGTVEEVLEIMTWGQLGFHSKPYALLNVDGYYDGLVSFLKTMVERGFLSKVHQEQLLCSTSIREIIEFFSTFRPTTTEKWVKR